MSKEEVRFLIQDLYRSVGLQLATQRHSRALKKTTLSNAVIHNMYRETHRMRAHVRDCLGLWAEQFPAAKYFKDKISGVGPQTAAGLAAYIDIEKCKTISSLWKFSGLYPDSRPPFHREALAILDEAVDKFKDIHGAERYVDNLHRDHIEYIANKLGYSYDRFVRLATARKGAAVTWNSILIAVQKPRYCKMFKQICMSLGNDIIKKKSVYQDLYRYRYAYEADRNDKGLYAKEAKKYLNRFDYDPRKKAYAAYSQGKLPETHLVNRAKRWATKILLAHYYMIDYYIRYGKAPPDVYALDVLKGERIIHIPGDWKKFIDERIKK
jgi:hypothetical protein